MKTEKKIVIPASERTEYSYTCDKCGKPCRDDEPTGSYDVLDVDLHADEGSRYPECSDVERVEFDCCHACFVEHVVPALEALGFKARTEDRGW